MLNVNRAARKENWILGLLVSPDVCVHQGFRSLATVKAMSFEKYVISVEFVVLQLQILTISSSIASLNPHPAHDMSVIDLFVSGLDYEANSMFVELV